MMRETPLLSRGEVDATQTRSREATTDGADGVVWSRDSWTTPPRLRELRLLRSIFLSRSHPSCAQEGCSRT
jgi:hypothetical protein